MRFHSPRLILKSYPGLTEVLRYAQDHGWSVVADSPADPAAFEHRRVVWRRHRDGTLEIHYGADVVTENAYVFASGGGPGLTRSLAGMLADNLDVWTLDDLVEIAAGPGGDIRPDMLVRVVMAAPHEFDGRVFALVHSALTAPEEKLRELAVWSTSINPWPQFRALLTEVAKRDRSAVIRHRATRMVAAFDAAGD
ncbi:hypothetical protein [Goodfellowiella coeruleoviolacea]|uniref:Uncharacterized protein n=1 Tax=Goodfellowiella coeruleoviolacea TaxID=334858 RepID=A0AAE3GHR9_9PSEU|nr:hypothetical protein [Goodfellowiella coeruleoviolacea]MCP2168431.1 hypothetical protein [Goodfellowiella coeruleoviolacea]